MKGPEVRKGSGCTRDLGPPHKHVAGARARGKLGGEVRNSVLDLLSGRCPRIWS